MSSSPLFPLNRNNLSPSTMPMEFKGTRKKRSALDTTSSRPEGDHRKRRRNRTTQSCLNCHTSKRMCDRKRPCGRCTQLGLTGLCVYEVDDPSRRSDAQDESSQLRRRVAELEAVIRELKNKPHPRWAQSGSTVSEESEKRHTRALSDPPSANPQTQSCQRSDTTEQETTEPKQGPFPREFPFQKDGFVFPQGECLDDTVLNFGLGLPFGPPSSLIMIPMDEHTQSHAAVSGEHQPSGDSDLASIFTSYPGLVSCDVSLGLDGRHYSDSHVSKPNNFPRISDSHCGCLNETTNYTPVLELSLWLRKVAEVLSHSSNHRIGATSCALNQRISDLDHFVITALTGTTNLPNQQARPSLDSRAGPSAGTRVHTVPPYFPVNSCPLNVSPSTISPQSLHNFRLRDISSALPNSSSVVTDSIMPWEPIRCS